MESSGRREIPELFTSVKTPAYVVDLDALEDNLKVIKGVKDRTGCKILLALKCFSMYSTFPLIRKYLDGVCASSANEARLGREEFRKEVHTFGAAYSAEDLINIKRCSDYIIFNSLSQWEKEKSFFSESDHACGLRINPEYSEIETELYNPCAKNSRLGITASELEGYDLEGITGFHFHAMCQQNADTLERILGHVEKKFGKYIRGMEWINFGGGHHIARKKCYVGDDYDVDLLCRLVNDFKKKYNVQVILEPGEGVVINTGLLVSSVLDIKNNGKDIAVLDASAAAHMPDVIGHFRPPVTGAGLPDEFEHSYLLAGPSCLAGDVVGEYSFRQPLSIGDKVVFEDMALYTMVKNTTFNGINLPSICTSKKGRIRIIKEFGYADFKIRL